MLSGGSMSWGKLLHLLSFCFLLFSLGKLIIFLFLVFFSVVRNSIPFGDSGQYSLSSISLAMHDVMTA